MPGGLYARLCYTFLVIHVLCASFKILTVSHTQKLSRLLYGHHSTKCGRPVGHVTVRVCVCVCCSVTCTCEWAWCQQQRRRDVTVVGYFFCDDPIPYRTTTPGNWVTLAQFKRLLSKRGNFRSVGTTALTTIIVTNTCVFVLCRRADKLNGKPYPT